MPRVTSPPTPSQLRPDGTLPAGWWHDVADGRLVCDLCPRECKLKPGDRGFCFVRQNRDGEMVLTTYGKSTGFCIDPIEKKPLNHFYPGTSVLSFGTAGCNLGCKFCQNHDISKARETELLSEHAMPDTIAAAAVELGCQSVAYTYNDPIIWAEYAMDTAKACRERGIHSVAVTAGYISPSARAPFFEYFDAANVDLKAFSEEFYEKVTLSHLQPILDTLQWLQQETDVWFEITNLLIPDANDSPDELRQMCDWILTHVGDQVPVHFSAFHPDFRMLDRPRTPHETLLQAHAIAKAAGIRHVYLGNVHDVANQSTYCDGCGQLVIERDWYQLGAYHLRGQQCGHCGHRLAGRFGDRPGTWGSKRWPVRITDFQPAPPVSVNSSNPVNKNQAMHEASATGTTRSPKQALNADQLQAITQAAGQIVTQAVTGRTGDLALDEMLSTLAQHTVHGVYVSLKRQGHLRGCCGFTNNKTTIVAGLQYAAVKTALEDPRFPPVSPSELPYLDLEVWLLGDLIRVPASGEARLKAIQVGRDGLFIQRGERRGLLLPGVATDRDWDEETFLRQVCIKAQLPPTAWREPDSVLHRFKGLVANGSVRHSSASDPYVPIVTEESIHQLAQFCRENVRLLASGALPNYYLQGVSDGMVHGMALMVAWPDGKRIWLSQKSLRAPMPLQSTLFSMSQDAVRQASQAGRSLESAQVDIAVLEEVALHGSSDMPDLRGMEENRALMLLGPGKTDALIVDARLSAEAKLQTLLKGANLRHDQAGRLMSFHSRASAPMHITNAARPAAGPEARPPAVAGRFYPATANALASLVRQLVPPSGPAPEKWRAAMVPHAGLQYSGAIAAEVLSQIQIPQSVVIIGPKHTPHGVDWAVAPHATWIAPGIEIANNRQLARTIAEHVPHLHFDAEAHRAEHAIEVELPLLHHFAPDASVVGIAIGSGSLDACREFAKGLAMALRYTDEDVLLLISSDMNHFASDAETRRLDEIALQAIETLDVAHIYQTVRGNEISMCGLLPAVITIAALQQLAPLDTARRVRYGTSTDVTHDASRAVGYAGMLFR